MITDAALALHDAGLCVLPAAADGTKMPALAWKQYQRSTWFSQQEGTS